MDFAQTYHTVEEEHIRKFLATFKRMDVKRGQLLLREGQVCRHIYYVAKGVIRCYTLEDGREINLHFYFEDEMASEFGSLTTENPSTKYLAALSHCTLLAAERTAYLPLFEEMHDLASAGMRYFQEMYLQEEQHATMLKTMKAEERYQYTLQHQPHLIERLPLTQIASFLGVGRENLSRIRSRKSLHSFLTAAH